MMFLKLVNKEIKYQLKSITFAIFCVFVILFYVTQFVGDTGKDSIKPTNPIESLKEGSNYIVYDRDKEDMDLNQQLDILKKLLNRDYKQKNTISLTKRSQIEYVDLGKEQLDLLNKIIKLLDEKKLSQEEYKGVLNELQNELGERTIYKEDRIKVVANKQIGYEQNLKEMQEIVKTEKVTGAYARLFCDYIGIGVGFFAVFIAAFSLVRDRKHKAHEIVYTKSISSVKYVLSKYIGNIILMLAVVILLAAYSTYDFHNRFGDIDYLAFFKYAIIWILPTIMMVTSLAYLLQVLFGNGILPIVVQFAYWFYSIPFSDNQYNITRYIIRYNWISTYTEYQEVAEQIMVNRSVIFVVSILILMVAMWIYEKKRGNICG